MARKRPTDEDEQGLRRKLFFNAAEMQVQQEFEKFDNDIQKNWTKEDCINRAEEIVLKTYITGLFLDPPDTFMQDLAGYECTELPENLLQQLYEDFTSQNDGSIYDPDAFSETVEDMTYDLLAFAK